jgi:hypothetical protein
MRGLAILVAAALAVAAGHATAASARTVHLTGAFELYVASASGDAVRRITHDGRDHHNPVWSPGGDYIAYEVHTSQGTRVEIITDDGQLVRSFDAGDAGGEPSWSSDGRAIAYIESYYNPKRSAQDGRLVVQEVFYGNERRVLARLATGRPVWGVGRNFGSIYWVRGDISPSGKTPELVPSIWSVRYDGTRRRRVVANASTPPQFSPDTKRILFERETPDATEIWTSKPNGDRPRLVTSAVLPFLTSWVPGGRGVWYLPQGDRPGIVVNRSGETWRLPRAAQDLMAWSSDGGLIAWQRSDRVGTIHPNGTDRRVLFNLQPATVQGSASSVLCPSLSWAPWNGRFLLACGTDYPD